MSTRAVGAGGSIVARIWRVNCGGRGSCMVGSDSIRSQWLVQECHLRVSSSVCNRRRGSTAGKASCLVFERHSTCLLWRHSKQAEQKMMALPCSYLCVSAKSSWPCCPHSLLQKFLETERKSLSSNVHHSGNIRSGSIGTSNASPCAYHLVIWKCFDVAVCAVALRRWSTRSCRGRPYS